MFDFNEETGRLTISATINNAYKLKKENEAGTVTVKNTINFTPDDTKKFFSTVEPVFKETGKKFTPSWFKKKEAVILKSLYDIAVLDTEDEKHTFDEWRDVGKIKGAKANIRMTLKKDDDGEYSGVIYPDCIHILEDGEEYNQFEGM